MKPMPAPARFLFDTDFAAPPPRPEPVAPSVPTIELPVHEALLAEAERAAYERGLAAGREAAEAKAAGRLADEAARLAAAAQSILGVLDVERARFEGEAIRLAEAIARKIAGRLFDLHPRDAVLAVVEDAIGPLRKAPHLVIRLASDDVEPIREALSRIAHERGFEGRLVVLGEPAIQRGDCRIEWADGGIVLDRAATEAAVTRALDAHLGAVHSDLGASS
jgi:flagellar assembly protein FliH